MLKIIRFLVEIVIFELFYFFLANARYSEDFFFEKFQANVDSRCLRNIFEYRVSRIECFFAIIVASFIRSFANVMVVVVVVTVDIWKP